MTRNSLSYSSQGSVAHAEKEEAFEIPADAREVAAKRKGRIFVRLTTPLFALLLLASSVLWVRSYWVNDYLVYGMARPAPKVCAQWGVVSNRGVCRVGWQQGDLVMGTGWSYTRNATFAWADRSTFWKRAGFNYEAKNNFQFFGRFCDFRIVSIPYWVFAGAFALMLAIPNRKSARVQRLFERFAAL